MKTLKDDCKDNNEETKKCDCFEKNLQIFGLLRGTNVDLSYYCPVCTRRYNYEVTDETK